jgi:hypothetical protein
MRYTVKIHLSEYFSQDTSAAPTEMKKRKAIIPIC